MPEIRKQEEKKKSIRQIPIITVAGRCVAFAGIFFFRH